MALKNGRTSASIQTNLTGSVHPPGVGAPFWGSIAPVGWVLASGNTVGNPLSGATERANEDTFYLFEVLWNSYSNAILAIQDSAGVASTRGASAAADYAANKRMPTIDMRGRTAVGRDNMGGTTASRVTAGESGITGTTLGATGGAQSHAITTAQLAIHTHVQVAHNHTQTASTGSLSTYPGGVAADLQADFRSAGSVAGGTDARRVADYFTNNAIANRTPTNNNEGSGSTHQNTQPSIICNYILKL
jgi:microcystin-dependent protein